MRLIIAEKPSVAGEIAKVVGATKDKGYYISEEYIVSWCVGHLIEAAKPEDYNAEWKKWSIETLPIIPETFITKVSERTKSQFEMLKSLMQKSEVTEIVEATDAGREGELIFRLVYEKAGCKKPVKRLWISSNEEKAIKEGLANMKPAAEYDTLYKAAKCRQEADWLIGINFTRLYSIMYGKTLTVGRVQTPTVNLIVKRQREISSFIPQYYYTITANLGSFNAQTRAEKKEDAERIVERCKGQEAYITAVEKQNKTENPAALYDLTELQRDANRRLGYSAQQTLDCLQSLYDKKLTTYPRTDSQYLTSDMEQSTRTLVDTLLASGVYSAGLTSSYDVGNVSLSRVVNDKKVTDHHAIIPTGSVTKAVIDSLPTAELNIFLLIAYRLLSAVYTPFKYTTTKANLDINGEPFTATGREIIETGYKIVDDQIKALFKSSESKEDKEEATLPQMAEGNTFHVMDVTAEQKKTKPPTPYTEDTLLGAMQTAGKNIVDEELKEAMKDSGLGTPATRASIIENIIKVGYIVRDKKYLLPTEMAETFIDLVVGDVKEPEMTAEWEKQLADIHKGNMSDADFMKGIIDFVRSFTITTKQLYTPENTAGVFKSEREIIGTCPKCGKNVVEYTKSYSCESGKGGCGFVIWKEVAKKTLTKAQATKLLKNRKTDLIKGFTSKANKPFDAFLILKEDNTTAFEFQKK